MTLGPGAAQGFIVLLTAAAVVVGAAPAGRDVRTWAAPPGGDVRTGTTEDRRHGEAGRSARARRWRGRLPTRRGRLSEAAAVSEVITHVASHLRAGASPQTAWEGVLGHGSAAGGVPRADELAGVGGGAGRRPHESASDRASHAAAVVAGARLAARIGAPLAAVLEVIATGVSESEAAADERGAALAGPATTARVLMWLPALGALLGSALGADPVGAAGDGGLGSLCVLIGLVLVAAGRIWTRALLRSAERAGRGWA